jgi:2-keto-3-deoxy-L-rhamnonate aldolase RhmA
LKTTKVKQKLKKGQLATGIQGSSVDGELIEFLGQFGFDAAWIECEHGPVTWNQIGDLSRACDLWDMTALVRVPSNEPWIITRTLDRGANGIAVPHVNTREQAERVVRSAKFGPVGLRGMYTGRRALELDTNSESAPPGSSTYFQKANEETLLVILIEEVEALENLAEILTVDEIDVFFVAPSDLAQTMGLTGQTSHPRARAAVDGAIRQIAEAGRVPGALVQEQTVEHFVQLGARFLMTGWDSWIAAGAKSYLAKVAAQSLPKVSEVRKAKTSEK